LIAKNQSPSHIFIGGSQVKTNRIDELISLKEKSQFTYGAFPKSIQISNEADAILFLSLISGRNPDYLIEHQVKAAAILRKTQLEVFLQDICS
jgi:putative glycerol-1-phosphate prenyltransferase